MTIRLFGLTAALLLASCATVSTPPAGPTFLDDGLFKPPAETIRAADLFALNDPMRRFLAHEVAQKISLLGPARGLYSVLQENLHIDYDAEFTRNAMETFTARSGNCMSLVVLTAAFAKELKIPVTYQGVYGVDAWSRDGNVAFHAAHINVSLGDSDRTDQSGELTLVVDFLPVPIGTRMLRGRLQEKTVVAMYMNNRAAEIMSEGNLDRAYWWARAATEQAPEYASSYNTLGVIYLKHGDLTQAEQTFRYLLSRASDDVGALSNLAVTLGRENKPQESEQVSKRLAELQPYPPFYFMDRGLSALRLGQYEAALQWFAKELARMPYDDELHFAAAVAELRLGRRKLARKHLELALRNSSNSDRHAIYAAKLAHLRDLR